jgi:hypothetical protein
MKKAINVLSKTKVRTFNEYKGFIGSPVKRDADRSEEKKPAHPMGFFLFQGEVPGELTIRANDDKWSVFVFERTLTPTIESSWVELGCSTRAQYTATGLESGKKYFFRYCKIDKNGPGPWSDSLGWLMAVSY